jgi:BASS family bile acid:Na+ symporter
LSGFLDLLRQVGNATILVFVVSSMMATGLGHTARQLLDPLRNVRLALSALLANFVVVPLGSLALAVGLRLEEPLAEGLLLLGVASGAPFLPKLTEVARGNLGFAVGAMVLLTIGTVLYVPLVLPRLLPEVAVDPLRVARPLLLFMLLPLGTGLVLRACREHVAAWLRPMFDRTCNATLLPAVVLVSALNIDNVMHVIGTRGILASLLLVVLGLTIGWLFGGSEAGPRRALALGTGLRNFAVAIVVASQSFDDPKVEIMVIVGGIVGLLVILPLARIWALRPAAA